MSRTNRIDHLRNSFVEIRRFLEYLRKEGLLPVGAADARLTDVLQAARAVDIDATAGLTADDAVADTLALHFRRANELLRARVETLDLVDRLLSAQQPSVIQGMSEDIAHKIERLLHDHGRDAYGRPLK